MPIKLITTREVAKLLRVTPRTVTQTLIPSKGLPSVPVGGQYRFVEKEILDWLVRQKLRTTWHHEEEPTPVRRAPTSGSKSGQTVAKSYENLLGPKTPGKPKKPSKTSYEGLIA